jgi:zinc transport system substrate-binding protein
VKVGYLVEPGKDPHTFDPTPKQLIALGEADLYFGIGFPFEKQILKKVQSTNPKFSLVETDRGIRRRAIDELNHSEQEDLETPSGHESLSDHEPATQDTPEAGEPDPHIWLGPEEIKKQALNIYQALAANDPQNGTIYKKNFDDFLLDLETVDSRLKNLFKSHRGRSFFVYHPSFGYFADAYELVQVSIETEGKSPTPRQVEMLIKRARKENVKVIFVEPQFDKKSAETIARAIGGAVVPIDPLAKDVLANLEIIADKIEDALR